MSKIKPQVSIIITVLNEAKTIVDLLESLLVQSYFPAEVIIVDGGSSDTTLEIVQKYKKNYTHFPLHILEKKGNRSIGRNFAFEFAHSDLIACTDAGCVPKKKWLEELVSKYIETNSPVIAGFYQGIAKTSFEEAVIPYALVMPDQVNQDTFLPATRSVLIKKTLWKRLGKFNETLSDNEDYEFAQRIKLNKIPISFAEKAIVTWSPRSTLSQFYWMIFRFARGDMYAGIIRPKVIVIFVRYILLLLILSITIYFKSLSLLTILIFSAVLYSQWAIYKNYKYCKKGWLWLPILQFTSDFAVLAGSLSGWYKQNN